MSDSESGTVQRSTLGGVQYFSSFDRALLVGLSKNGFGLDRGNNKGVDSSSSSTLRRFLVTPLATETILYWDSRQSNALNYGCR